MHPYTVIGRVDLTPPDGILVGDVDPEDGKRWFIPCPRWAEVGEHDGKLGVVVRDDSRIVYERYNLTDLSFKKESTE